MKKGKRERKKPELISFHKGRVAGVAAFLRTWSREPLFSVLRAEPPAAIKRAYQLNFAPVPSCLRMAL